MKTQFLSTLSCALACAMASTGAFADSSPTFVFDGTQSAYKFDFNDTETHNLYGTEYYQDTCYSREAVGSHEECTTNKSCSDSPEQVCHTDSSGHESCTNITARRCDHSSDGGGGGGSSSGGSGSDYTPTRTCTNVTDYEDVPYSCTQSRTVVIGNELDYRDHFLASVQFSSVPMGFTFSDKFEMVGTGSGARLELLTKSPFIYRLTSTDHVETTKPKDGPSNPGAKEIKSDFKIQPLVLKAALEPYAQKISNIKIEKGIVSFVVGRVTYPELFATAVKLDHHRRIFGYKQVFSSDIVEAKRVIQAIEVEGQPRSKVSIALADLEQTTLEGKLRIGVTIGYKTPSGVAILNDAQLDRMDPITETVKVKYEIK